MMIFRVGQGFDAHAFTAGRDLVLGGVKIPYSQGLSGHSDADVLLHAIADALLGALALGDIGYYFPSDDDRWRDADSRQLLREVYKKMTANGYQLVNVDATIIAQVPKLSPYTAQMRKNIAKDLQASGEQVSVKASTTDRLGFCGREEGIAAQAIVLVSA